MPYTVPTSQQFLTRFPIFGDVDSDLIDALIAEASNKVDSSWNEGDYQPAIMYLAAHLLATDNSAEGDVPEVGAAGGKVVASQSFGSGLSVSYASGGFSSMQGSLSSDDEYGTTEYGRRYLSLLRLNKSGPLVI